MPVGHPAKSAQIERTQFVPSTLTADNAPLLRLHTAGITLEGRTNFNTCYIPVSTLSAPDLSNIGSNERTLFSGDWDECPLEYEEGSQEIICEPSFDKHKCTAADTPLLAWIPERWGCHSLEWSSQPPLHIVMMIHFVWCSDTGLSEFINDPLEDFNYVFTVIGAVTKLILFEQLLCPLVIIAHMQLNASGIFNIILEHICGFHGAQKYQYSRLATIFDSKHRHHMFLDQSKRDTQNMPSNTTGTSGHSIQTMKKKVVANAGIAKAREDLSAQH
ncbi:hypothetical protein EV702DRAFT_1041987 [Suillus placidus]|uniref:Uncharacterized protein n=1 Tax=Suillus placidus TaxID=48579 RepID=A0A9P7A337_9AGAM|nr:hypothetical protein EV702DRAFT_1041987 [Suillus placidus]